MSTSKNNDTSNIPVPPKRPPPSYISFMTSKKDEVKTKHPGKMSCFSKLDYCSLGRCEEILLIQTLGFNL